MPELTPEEKQKIYAEEKARLEAQEKVKRELKDKKQKQTALGCLIAGLAFIGLVVFAAKSCSVQDTKKTTTRYEMPSQQAFTAQPEIAIELGVKSILEPLSKEIISVYVPLQQNGGYGVTVDYLAKENLTTNLTRSGIFLNAFTFMRELFQDKRFDKVKWVMLKPQLTLVDKYKNKSLGLVAKITLERKTANKINWGNMEYISFEELLRDEGQLWIHPALR